MECAKHNRPITENALSVGTVTRDEPLRQREIDGRTPLLKIMPLFCLLFFFFHFIFAGPFLVRAGVFDGKISRHPPQAAKRPVRQPAG